MKIFHESDEGDENFSRDDERNSMMTTETFRRDVTTADEIFLRRTSIKTRRSRRNFSRDDERDATSADKTFHESDEGDGNFFT
jgi:hypothetical protein